MVVFVAGFVQVMFQLLLRFPSASPDGPYLLRGRHRTMRLLVQAIPYSFASIAHKGIVSPDLRPREDPVKPWERVEYRLRPAIASPSKDQWHGEAGSYSCLQRGRSVVGPAVVLSQVGYTDYDLPADRGQAGPISSTVLGFIQPAHPFFAAGHGHRFLSLDQRDAAEGDRGVGQGEGGELGEFVQHLLHVVGFQDKILQARVAMVGSWSHTAPEQVLS